MWLFLLGFGTRIWPLLFLSMEGKMILNGPGCADEGWSGLDCCESFQESSHLWSRKCSSVPEEDPGEHSSSCIYDSG
jgi:hypothetical protein